MCMVASEVANDASPFVRVYKDGTVERLEGTEIVPPSIDPQTGVQSKDVVIAPETGVSARLYMPKTTNPPDIKLPLLVYYHGGAFFVQTAFSPTYQHFLNSLVAEANIIVVSVDYRRAPEHPLPVAYDDSWAALKWVASHSNGGGDEVWLKDHVDFERLFIAGDSAGANIAHNMAMRVGSEELDGVNVKLGGGLVLIHPYFWGKDPIGAEAADMDTRAHVDKLWRFACPWTSGSDDPLINPAMDPKLSRLGCTRVLVCVAEIDVLRERGWDYYEKLGKSGWEGVVEIMETEGEKHVFHLDNPNCEKAMDVLKRVISFINPDKAHPITPSEVVQEIPKFIRVYKDGRVERLGGTDIVPPSINPETGVQSKDAVIAPEIGVSARLYVPKTANSDQKLPLLVYFHGGGFCIETAFSPVYHHYLNALAAEANVVVVSVDYRRAPEHPLPLAYDDSWVALKWVASHSHSTGGGHEVWLKDYVDFESVFLGGDSAGANIAHNMAIRVGSEELDGVKLAGIVLVHPYFWGKEPIGAEAADMNKKGFVDNLWVFVCPSTSGLDDPLINPVVDPKLSRLGCSKVLVCVAEKDVLRDRGWYYHEALGKSGWGGVVEIMEVKGEDHVFHLFNPTCENAVTFLKRVASFLNHDNA